jgi:lipooligosaccharide transport system ATP-binding protein
MKRRLIIARALIANPDLVILDEPTTGLDPQARVLIWQRLLALKGRGKTLLLSTHYMEEAARLCDWIMIIDHGRILDAGAPGDLIHRHVRGHVIELAKPLPAALAGDGPEREDIGDAILFYVRAPGEVTDRLPAGHRYLARPANLEDVFLRLTGRQLREGG